MTNGRVKAGKVLPALYSRVDGGIAAGRHRRWGPQPGLKEPSEPSALIYARLWELGAQSGLSTLDR